MSGKPRRFFLDTNVLVYTFDDASPLIRAQAGELVELALTTGSGIVSYQVVQEFLNVATRKFAVPLSDEDAGAYLQQVLAPLCRVWPSMALYQQALEIQQGSGYGFYDSIVVASAIAGGCRTLYTQDLQAGRQFGSLTVVDPFVA
jgi:predicted nucleic acid-binding protein